MPRRDGRPTQVERVLHAMRKQWLTGYQALHELGVIHLPRRIADIKAGGYRVEDKWITVPVRGGEETRVKAYRLAKGQRVSR